MPQQNPWAQCFFESQKGLLESSVGGWDFWEGIQQIGGLCCVCQWGWAKKEQKAASSSGGTAATVVKELIRDW